MAAHRKAEPFPGLKLYQCRAEAALPILVRQAHAQEEIAYGDLAKEMAMPNARNLNYVLGSIGFTLLNLADEWKTAIPPIQTIVINKNTGIPGGGGQWFVAGDDYEKIPAEKRRLLIKEKHKDVFLYPKWRDVLNRLGLPEVDKSYDGLFSQAANSGRGSGESERHKKFKLEVCQNPSLAGLRHLSGKGQMEYPLPSGDWLDVCFDTEKHFAAIEVKTIKSDIADITRGLFQCVKYRAVMNGMVALKRSQQSLSVVLLLEGRLPTKLFAVRNALGVKVVELGRSA